MFYIDDDGSIVFRKDAKVLLLDEEKVTFESAKELREIADARGWSKAAVTGLYNQTIERHGLKLQPQKAFKNRMYGLAKVWDAIQALTGAEVPERPVEEEKTVEKKVKEVKQPKPKAEKKAKSAKKVKPAKAAKKSAKKKKIEPKDGSNLSTLVTMINRKSGASIAELMEKTGWTSEHTVRGRISILKSSGVKIKSTRDKSRGRVYRAA